jgi:hypothetical protein
LSEFAPSGILMSMGTTPAIIIIALGAIFIAASTASAQDAAALRALVQKQAIARGMPPELAHAVVTVESAYRPDAVGDVGEVGLMQVRPSTARMLGFAGTDRELFAPETNIRFGVEYLAQAYRLSDSDICTTVMKYRAGHGETRFSHRSVAYCARVRTILKAEGFPVTGVLPVATFGDPVTASAASGTSRRAGRRSRTNWSAYQARVKAIDGRVANISIMQ